MSRLRDLMLVLINGRATSAHPRRDGVKAYRNSCSVRTVEAPAYPSRVVWSE
jgi:hypothetical protein